MNNNVIDQIVTISQNFDKNIENDRDDRGLLSQNILNGLRNLVEHIALHIHNIDTKSNLNNDFKNLQIGIQNIKNKAKYTSIIKLHSFLQISTSHYTPEEEKSERLILKYMPYLYSLKELCKKDLKLDILHNINKFPINLDKLNAKYYENIANKIEQPINYEKSRSDKFYIQTIKPFIINDKIYYEITFTIAKNNISKFDKIIAFSKYNIPANYSVELKLYDTNIRLHKSIPIIIITEWNISIRPCELKNFCSIFGLEENFNRNKEYENFMSVLKKYRITLFELVKLNNKEYLEIKSYFTQNSLKILFTCLDKARNIILNNKKGKNILSYILYNMNNAIIKKQKADQVNKRLSNLYLDNKCIPFEEMPFCTSLIKHNPKFIDLCECIEIENKKYELLARSIKNNSEINGFLYKNISDFKNTSKKDIYDLVKQYNENITYEAHKPKRHIEILYEKFLYINEYEDIVKHIIKQLKKFTKNGIDNYQQDVEKWLSSNQLDCKEKEKHLINLFHNSKLALIYGAAGTGKTTLIKHISHFFKNKTQLFLTNTNTAINNLKQRIDADKSYFYTLASYINNKKTSHSYFDVVIIDECSTINNQDMLKILEIIKCDILICVGDIYQIEAIRFGNWFLLAQKIFTKHQIELQNIYRTEDKELQNIWNKVRKFDNAILEFFSKNNISKKIEDFSFEKSEEDEIILCLNYGGLHGVNNINRLLQENNRNEIIYFNGLGYKVGDPILFNEATTRFGDIIHNNLKGIITRINKEEDCTIFTIKVNKKITEENNFKIINTFNDNYTEIAFEIYSLNSDEEDDEYNIVPFQVAYAISIHKAQGLEYNNVSIIIANEIEEQITHNIFYTAITRAKKKLKIYWSPETENKILNALQPKNIEKELEILKQRIKSSCGADERT